MIEQPRVLVDAARLQAGVVETGALRWRESGGLEVDRTAREWVEDQDQLADRYGLVR